jgi:hypothetical protein
MEPIGLEVQLKILRLSIFQATKDIFQVLNQRTFSVNLTLDQLLKPLIRSLFRVSNCQSLKDSKLKTQMNTIKTISEELCQTLKPLLI